ncbi:hypothetical protein CBR_g3664 [Chara braunii]|uniref:Reverse transcriptase domain-containing protein n=1 Tax=Chara braunii TaxID=69332 RepID=A0A388KFZ0_CHABU|nr:hypothetical protein CBR_g3664 [Chara braunii]|eukprot:GBG68965.1 hypothetical protein CBR_g3664 [Chara braunii]
MVVAPIANGPGRVGALMEEVDGGGSALATTEEAAELIPLDQYVSLGYPELGMIETIRPAPEQKEVAEWRPSPGEMESGGPTFVTGEIDVLNIVRALDHRIPLSIVHLLSISEQANEQMLQHCEANRKRFALARTPNVKAKSPSPEENMAGSSDPIRVGLIQKDDHFLQIKPIPWKFAECDIEIRGIPYNAIIDSGAAVLATLLRVVERAGRKNDLIMLSEKDQLVSADEEKIKTVGRMTNVAFRLGKVHALGDVVVLDVNTYDVLFGLPALVALRANQDFERRSIVLRNTRGKPYAVPMKLTLRTTINAVPRVSLMMAGTLRMISWDESADGKSSTNDADNSDEDDPEISKLAPQCVYYPPPRTIARTMHLTSRNVQRTNAMILGEPLVQISRMVGSLKICNVPATFQRAMNMIFQNFVNKTWLTQGMINFCVIVYMDDILVYSETYHGHAQHIEWTLGALRDAGFKITLENSEFFLSKISFLGYVVTRGGLRPNSRKVAAVREARVPTSLTQVQAFSGLASYYRRFIKGFAAIARPLTNLLRKDKSFTSRHHRDSAGDSLRHLSDVARLGWGSADSVDRSPGSARRHRRAGARHGPPASLVSKLASDRAPGASSLRVAPMSHRCVSYFGLPSSIPTLWQSVQAPTLSYRVKENSAPLLSEEKWDTWWEDYIELAFCLLEIEFRWSEAAPFGEGPEHPEDSVELLIIQAWRTAEQGDLLGIVFGKAEEGNLALITDELLVFLTQLMDDLPLDILSHSDKQPDTHMLSRTLEPHLVRSTCTEIDEDNCLYPSQALYLEIDVTDLTFWDPIARQNAAQDEEIGGAGEEEEEEEPSSEERDDPDYVLESEAGIADESSQPRNEEVEEGNEQAESDFEGFEAEVRDAARERAQEHRKRKRQETAEGKRPATNDPSIGDPWRDQEPPEEEDDGTGAEGSRSGRRRKSESPVSSGSPSRSSIRLHQDLGVRVSSPVVLSPTP